MPVTTEARIRRAVLGLFASHGFEATGIREIAKEANISVATLYHYMSSKEDLLVALIRDATERLISNAEAIIAQHDPPAVTLASLVGAHVRQHAEESVQCIVADSELRSLTGINRRDVIALRDHYQGAWEMVVQGGVDEGTFSVPDVKSAVFGLLAMCNGVARWYTPKGPKSIDEISEVYAQLALNAVTVRPRPRKRPSSARQLIATNGQDAYKSP